MNIKAAVTCNLNARSGRPSVNAPCPFFYKEGDIVTVGDMVKGDVYEGNDIWYKLKNESFIWSGGVAELIPEDTPSLTTVATNYNSLYEFLPGKYRKNGGKSIKIALIDSGFNEHECLKDAVKGIFAASDLGTFDKTGHGTFLCGIVGGRKRRLKDGILGVAPKCDLYVAKAQNQIGLYALADVTRALKWAIEEVDADLINFSLHIFDHEQSDSKGEFLNLIGNAIDKNKLLIASAGENSSLTKDDITYPASEDGFISVGAIGEASIKENEIHEQVNYVMPYVLHRSCFPGSAKYLEDKGSSISSAIVTGLLALLSGQMGSDLNRADAMNELGSHIEPFSHESNLEDPKKLYKL